MHPDFFPVMLDCADESNAGGVDFCASDCRDVLQSFEDDCDGIIPHSDTFMTQQYAPLLAALQECNGETPDDSQLLASNCVLVNHLSDDNCTYLKHYALCTIVQSHTYQQLLTAISTICCRRWQIPSHGSNVQRRAGVPDRTHRPLTRLHLQV